MRTHDLLRIAASALALAGCTRSVPAAFPRGAAASPHAASAPPAVVSRALLGDPPLPDEAQDGWEALGSAAAPAHAGHAHGGHGDAP